MIIDLETLGTEPGCVVTQLAAITDNGKTFCMQVDIASAVQLGLTIDPSTLSWWLARDSSFLVKDAVAAAYVLRCFIDFCNEWRAQGELVWVRGPDFDIPILERWCLQAGKKLPWKYNTVRDVRTAEMLVGRVEEASTHNALDDCRRDFKIVNKFLEAVKCAT